jgi:hypothetical protein
VDLYIHSPIRLHGVYVFTGGITDMPRLQNEQENGENEGYSHDDEEEVQADEGDKKRRIYADKQARDNVISL